MSDFDTSIPRRRFLLDSAVCGVAAAAADIFSPQLFAEEQHARSDSTASGIAELHLHTTQLEALHRFYDQILQLPTKKEGNELRVDAGNTRILFESVKQEQWAPFYHFAFNIPENKLELARQWQKNRTPLIRRGETEVIHFEHWNAHSVFFNDPAGNILEYIARHDLNNSAKGDFTSQDILYASEIGLVVDDVPAAVEEVEKQLGLGIYRDDSRFFASMGDEHALVLLVKQDRKWTPDRVRAAKPFPTVAAIRGLRPGLLKMATYDYQVTIESSLTSEHQRFMSEAIAEARKSADAGGVPLGCVLVKEGRIIGRGHNRRIQDSDPIMHAEIAALRDALRQGDLDACRGATLYCTGMSCDMCAAANVYWGVKEVVLARLDGYKNNRPLYEANGVRVIEVDLDEPKRLLKQFNETHP